MDQRSICVFDSGLGGLTSVHTLRTILPNEHLIYFGDTARVPYGSRARDTLLKYARQDIRFLRTFDPKAILVACGTISTTALPTLQAENDLPILGVVEATCHRALAVSRTKRIGVIATQASIRSNAYQDTIRKLEPSASVLAEACSLLVPLVEAGRVQKGDVVIETVAREYLEPLAAQNIDTLILGCTHYPLLTDIISGIMGTGVTLVSAGEEAAFALKRLLKERDWLSSGASSGSVDFYASDRTEDFQRIAALFLREELHDGVHKIDIDQY